MTSARLTILGSTGSIGTQAVDVITRYPDLARVHALAATGSRPQLLAEQIARLQPRTVAVADDARVDDVQRALHELGEDPSALEFTAGPGAVIDAAGDLGSDDVVLNAMTGSVGLAPSLAALDSGARLALANKETLIAGGSLVRERAADGQLLPVDSEHTAIAECLAGMRPEHIRRLVITASGGPFRGRTRAELGDVTPADALAHPTWDMGRVITTNSATLVNKALEVIEACWLFDLPEDRVDTVVHPQSIVHSMVTATDGSTIAQASPPDMRLAIGWALAHPDRLEGLATELDFTTAQSWTFEPLDEDTFPAVRIARAAHRDGGTRMAQFNAANEEFVDAFHEGRIGFLQIVDLIQDVLDDPASPRTDPIGVEDVQAAETWARTRAHELIDQTEAASR
ncbi:1-deoxy-D-xylulose-5-phosphate reductoisomerase [Helcobacillus massiliensis]|uniref:1-deoxy-D-xylulose-5-phosphate reductoisomerase n=1 Tax=Helcobacillus TaxID=1161125 RepID=UPI001EF642CA|nr:1-deoxy-D-xylulose-5-phosphate reductoisomerase [Helcobacillus massiliensis]MCG7427751.1 1-deoxy-D-xylulose-5-phosphate reductoisomerase [Helcobacillus sp. ACRRO]MCT1557892.1 1-deoxy-D-xylulose-5-phosphate reductoisomerase [Helcobacillus massiliensis]MCT2036516.1 1-deoxy-D-xylulose-5-phosphate reductoisomerase [Helcobacillus massiliensis]MCT2332583.1 1-deoxy-D-xylulose-5-phosphate reductoisomerase [Helcobacillus massiliensis]